MSQYVWFNNSTLINVFANVIEFGETYVFGDSDLDGNRYETKIRFECDDDSVEIDRFDLAVMDAIYTLQKKGKRNIYVSNNLKCNGM